MQDFATDSLMELYIYIYNTIYGHLFSARRVIRWF